MIELDEAGFRREALSRASTAVVEFHAPWCPFSALIGPKLRRIAARYGDGLLVARLDVSAHADLARELGIEFVPALAVFEKGLRKGLWYGDPPMGAVFAAVDALDREVRRASQPQA